MGSTKQELRADLKKRRQGLSKADTETTSQAIIARCIELINWENISSFHCYVPVTKEHEVDSWHLLEHVWVNYPEIQTLVPVRNDKGDYDSVAVNAETTWRRDRRIPEPESGEILPAHTQFDVIAVPMLGFDKYGYRLGHGKGWYDRFLAIQSGAKTIGVCYEAGLIANLPHEAHDIPMHYIVTERSVRKIV